jgi:serine/threonine protein kinase
MQVLLILTVTMSLRVCYIQVIGVVGGTKPCAIMKLVPLDCKPLADRPDSTSVLKCKWATDAIFTPEAVMRIGANIARALEYLHSKGIAHGDVYAHNVLAGE